MEKELVEQIVYLILGLGGIFGVYKAWIDYHVQVTSRKAKEEEEKTKRSDTIAKENSLGETKFALIKVELEAVQSKLDKYQNKIDGMDEVIKSLDFMCRLIEARIINPNQPMADIYRNIKQNP